MRFPNYTMEEVESVNTIFVHDDHLQLFFIKAYCFFCSHFGISSQ